MKVITYTNIFNRFDSISIYLQEFLALQDSSGNWGNIISFLFSSQKYGCAFININTLVWKNQISSIRKKIIIKVYGFKMYSKNYVIPLSSMKSNLLSLKVVNFCPIPTNELHEIVQTRNIFDVMMNLCYCLNYGLYGLSMQTMIQYDVIILKVYIYCDQKGNIFKVMMNLYIPNLKAQSRLHWSKTLRIIHIIAYGKTLEKNYYAHNNAG